jgi:hypothetical protein
MARIIRCDHVPENVGAIVETRRLACLSTWLNGLPHWEIKPAWPMRFVDMFGTRPSRILTGNEPGVVLLYPDPWLEPIEPPATSEVEETEEALTV